MGCFQQGRWDILYINTERRGPDISKQGQWKRQISLTFSLVFLDTVVCFVMIPWGWFIGIPFMYNSLVWFTMGFKYMHT